MNLEHPLITQVNRYGYPLDNLPQVFYCDCCGDPIEGDCFELDGYIYCDVDCLTKNTDVRFGNVYEFKNNEE